VLVSPESAAGIKAGAKTGLSTLVTGTLFLVAAFFGPLLGHIPAAGTSPLLFVVGMVLFQNVGRIKWHQSREALTAFVVLLLIPFTYSITTGIWFGYFVYLGMGIFTGES
jgi:AGZA family xanthine/uracil permease-like MFS transporter